MEFIQQIGALAGLAAFVGLAVLAMLYFTQAKDVRRLRENASFLIEGPEAGDVTEPPAAQAAAEPASAAKPSKGKGKAPAKKPPSDAEAFRRAELARQAAERRERFERRRRGGRLSRGGEGRFSSLPEPRALAVIVVGAALLAAGVFFVATGVLGGDDEPASSAKGGVVPQQTDVAVLNGTSEPGLAAEFTNTITQQGFNVDVTGNTSFPFETSTVMFEKPGESAAKQISRLVKIPKVEPVVQQVRPEAGGAVVVVVLGDDKAGA